MPIIKKDLQRFTIKELKKIGKDFSIKLTSKLKKFEMIELISGHPVYSELQLKLQPKSKRTQTPKQKEAFERMLKAKAEKLKKKPKEPVEDFVERIKDQPPIISNDQIKIIELEEKNKRLQTEVKKEKLRALKQSPQIGEAPIETMGDLFGALEVNDNVFILEEIEKARERLLKGQQDLEEEKESIEMKEQEKEEKKRIRRIEFINLRIKNKKEKLERRNKRIIELEERINNNVNIELNKKFLKRINEEIPVLEEEINNLNNELQSLKK